MASTSTSTSTHHNKGKVHGRRGGGGGGGGGGQRRRAFNTQLTDPSHPSSATNIPHYDHNNKNNKQLKPADGNRDGDGDGDGNDGDGDGDGDSSRSSDPHSNPHPDQDQDQDPDSEDLCFICAEPIKFYSIGQCNHTTCHICAIRLRALYKKKECTFCKAPNDQVIFTNSPTATFQDFLPTTSTSPIPTPAPSTDPSNPTTPSNPPTTAPTTDPTASSPPQPQYTDPKLGILFQTSEIMSDTLSLLRFNCPRLGSGSGSSGCKVVCEGWADLKRHVRRAHGRVMCDLCTRNKKIFTYEHSLYTSSQLSAHYRYGDSTQPSSSSSPSSGSGSGSSSLNAKPPSSGFTGHPSCDYCKLDFYDSDQLFEHCRDRHEQCFICNRTEEGRWKYFLDYRMLESHFKQTHHLCPHPSCLSQRFVVFDSDLDLKAHALEIHPGSSGGSGGAGGLIGGGGNKKDGRRIETHFTYSGNNESGRGSGGRNRGERGGGGRNGNTNRNRQQQEQANDTTISSEPSGSGLGSHSHYSNSNSNLRDPARIIPGLAQPPPSSGGSGSGRPGRPHFDRNLSEPPPYSPQQLEGNSTNANTEDEAAHAALLKKVSQAVDGSENKIGSFRSAVRAFRNSESSANDCIDTLFNVFDRKLEISDDIVQTVIDLLDNDDKRNDLMDAWREFRIEHTSFPALTPIAPTVNGLPASTAISSSFRKSLPKSTSSTTTTRQSPSALWARVERAAASTSRTVPGLPTTSNRPFGSGGSGSGGGPSRDAFPALPQNIPPKRPLGKSATPWSPSAAGRGPPPRPSTTPAVAATNTFSQDHPPLLQSSSSSTSLGGGGGPSRQQNKKQPNNNAPAKSAEFPSLPSSSVAVERQARLRAALSPLKDEDPFSTMNAPKAWTTTSSGPYMVAAGDEPPGPSSSTDAESNNNNAAKRKKKPQKVVLFKGGMA